MKLLRLLLPFVYCVSLGAQDLESFFSSADALMQTYVEEGKVDYEKLKAEAVLIPLVDFIAAFDHRNLPSAEEKAYVVNAYNILVIQGVIEHYPINSLLKVFGFFDQRKWTIGGKSLTLDQFEKDYILKKFPDPRLHFVLACGAAGCPPLASFAYRPKQVETQLDDRTTLSLDDPSFVRVEEDRVGLSQIFNWYAQDFGGNKQQLISYVNQFRTTKLASTPEVYFYPYDWSLNDQNENYGGNNASRYVVSSTRPKGGYELKWFNNLYTQVTPQDGNGDLRESYFTSIVNFVYGFTDRFNAGFDLRYRGYAAQNLPASPFSILSTEDALRSRGVVATLGPKIRVAPNINWPNFSIQSALWIPLRNDLSGQTGEPWVDWSGMTWWTQIFNDFTLGSQFSIFAEFDILWEDIGRSGEHDNRLSTPMTGIFSYFPNRKTTLYALANFSPLWSPELDYFFQPGLGAKYQFTPRFELELLYTYFDNSFLRDVGGNAATFNIGLRFSR